MEAVCDQAHPLNADCFMQYADFTRRLENSNVRNLELRWNYPQFS